MLARRIAKTLALCLTIASSQALIGDERASFSQISRFTPVEPAGSKGITGYSLGGGLSIYSISQLSNDQKERLNLSYDSERLILNQIYFNKGLFSPIDFGLSAAASANSEIQRFGGYLQWTLFEGFKLPALSVRGYYQNTYGIRGAALRSEGIEGLVAYSFFRYFTVYAGKGMLSSKSSITRSFSEGPDTTSELVESSYPAFVGAKILYLPPFATISLESDTIAQNRNFFIKAALQM